ncbi:D-alanyl-D-alanine carboxypeptidase fraction C [Klebsiella michiganensis]|nr:D-alanyl-D-alanine carboxypeptidase fraction C [Klebsiella michiganensis]
MALMTHDAFPFAASRQAARFYFSLRLRCRLRNNSPMRHPIDARAWILMDYASGKVLSEGNADEKLDPASLTKIMTSYVVGPGVKGG